MSPEKRYEIGDWVRFYQNGRLVVGIVEYTEKNSSGYLQLHTDIGSVDARYVLEFKR